MANKILVRSALSAFRAFAQHENLLKFAIKKDRFVIFAHWYIVGNTIANYDIYRIKPDGRFHNGKSMLISEQSALGL